MFARDLGGVDLRDGLGPRAPAELRAAEAVRFASDIDDVGDDRAELEILRRVDAAPRRSARHETSVELREAHRLFVEMGATMRAAEVARELSL